VIALLQMRHVIVLVEECLQADQDYPRLRLGFSFVLRSLNQEKTVAAAEPLVFLHPLPLTS
jgi:hypothetical protein